MAHNWRSLGTGIVIALAYAGCGGGGQTKQEGGVTPQTTVGGETNAMTTEEALRAKKDLAQNLAQEPRAEAKLQDAPGIALQGDAKFEAEADGVRVTVSVKDATPGEHGIHVHQLGDCSDIPGKSMGEHLQPEGNPHGLPDQPVHHLGDMGNIAVGADGKGKLEFVIKDATLDNGRNGLLGKALVVHEKEDIGVGKSGESGTPIACGVIQSKP